MDLARTAFLLTLLSFLACTKAADPNKEIPAILLKFPTASFAYPVGGKDYVTEKNDWWDEWYNAQDFGENRHLGEDWNANSGGDSDCGAPVFAAADGLIVLAKDAGPGWGNVMIIEHVAKDGTEIRSLYGHLGSIAKNEGRVARREQIGTVGNANGRYKCHLHFEMRWRECPVWGDVGGGYSDQRHGWIDPSEFIDAFR